MKTKPVASAAAATNAAVAAPQRAKNFLASGRGFLIMVDFALIIPAYNEAGKIKNTIEQLVRFFSSEKYWQDKCVTIVLVNDGSTDNTNELISQAAQAFSSVKIEAISYPKNQGKGAAIRAGIKAVPAKAYGFLDADLAYDPTNLIVMHQKLNTADCVIGERNQTTLQQGYSYFRQTTSKFFHRLTALLTKLKFRDTQCGIKVFNQSSAQTLLQLNHVRFSFDIEFLAQLQIQGKTIVTHPVTFSQSTSSSITFRDGLRYFLDVVSISDQLNHPPTWRFYTLLTLTSTIITLVFFGWVLRAGYFFSDDFTWLWHGQKIGFDLYKVVTYLMSSFYSPVLNAFYAWSLPLAKLYAPYYLAIGLLVHVIVSVLSGALVQRLFSSRIMAFLAVILVALAGGAREPLLWVGANMHSIVSLFILACLIQFDTFLTAHKIRNFIFSLLFFLLALGTKETAVILPALLLMILVFRWKDQKIFILKPTILISAFLFLAPYGFYLYKQYLWQTSGIWISNGTWNFDLWRASARLPFVILDLFLPIKPFINYSHSWLVGAFATVSLTWLGFKYHTLPAVRAGFYWIIISIAPTIFFATERLSDPLPSRYAYLPRIGAIIILSGLFAHFIKNNYSRSVINFFAIILVGISLTHVAYMVKTTGPEYTYVYNTGRTLVDAINIIEPKTEAVFVHDSRPFADNQAHIVGALDVIRGIKENQIIFIDRNTPLSQAQKILPPNSSLLYWDHQQKTYKIFVK